MFYCYSDLCREGSSRVSPEDSEAGSDFAVALFNLLSALSAVPEALTQALEPYLDGGQVWEHLYSLPGKRAFRLHASVDGSH